MIFFLKDFFIKFYCFIIQEFYTEFYKTHFLQEFYTEFYKTHFLSFFNSLSYIQIHMNFETSILSFFLHEKQIIFLLKKYKKI
jgi:hypothetical protein